MPSDRLEVLEPLWNALREHHATAAAGWLPAPRARADSWARRRAKYESWLGEGDGFALVAREGGRSVGYAMVRMGPGSQTWPLGERGADLESLALLPGARGRGVGLALLEAAKREASRRGASTMDLIVMENNEQARRFYEREGFRPFARMLSAPLDTPERD